MMTPEAMDKRIYKAIKEDLSIPRAKRVKKLRARKTSLDTSYFRAKKMVDYYIRLGVLRSGDSVIDVGCGHGLIALPMVEMGCRYFGIEVSMPCIKRSRYVFKETEQVKFYHMDVRSQRYNNRKGKLDEYQVKFPFGDCCVDAIIARSLFTHFETIEGVKRYLAEMHRCLVSGGRLYATFFLSPPNEACKSVARRVFSQGEIVRSLSCFETLSEFDGITSAHGDQWKVILKKV